MKGAFEVLLVIMLAWNAITQPVCKPNNNNNKTCNRTTDNVEYRDEHKYFFEIKGRNQHKVNQVLVTFKEEQDYICLCCNGYDDKKDGYYRLSADDPVLPTMSPRISVTKVEFKGCTVPINGSYHEALEALNITFAPGKNSLLKLTELPADPQLEEHHFDGLPIKKLLITAEYSYKPTRPKFNFLNKLQHLEDLELRQNVVLEKGAIERLPVALVKLTLKNTRLPTAENELRNGSFWLERLRSLRYLHLWEDPKHEGWANRTLLLPPLATLPNLTFASFNSVPLVPITESSQWLKDSKLQSLELKSCKLKELPGDFFEGANLNKLSLYNNSLTSLPEGVFSPLKGLTELNLSENKLDGKTLQLVMKPLIEQLKVLKANKNPLGSLCGYRNYQGTQSSKLPTSLRELELMNTGAKRICDDWIQNDALMNIHLENNDISSLSYKELMMKRRQVKPSIVLRLNNNPLRAIEVTKEDFVECHNASSYADRGNYERVRVELWLTTLSCECDNAHWLMETLRSCSLLAIMTRVSCDPKPTAGKPLKLQDYGFHDITCGYNGPCPTGCECWKRSYDNATVVQCAGTLPREPQWPPSAPGWPVALHVGPGTLTAMPNITLVELHAANNNITRIGDNDISNTLRVLDVQNNSIAHISIKAAERLLHQRDKLDYRVSLAGNPLACACEDAHAISKLKLANITDWEKTKCIDGNYVMEKTKIEMCENKFLLPLLVLLGTSFTLTLVIVFIRYKLPKIRQFMFDHNICLEWVLGVKDDKDDLMKTQDVFISYSYKDYVFAKKLIEKLEERGHSTIEHCRDWDPGKTIIQQITHSVMSARRTLLLVSDNYAKSKWGLEEFHAAHAHAMENGSARVIVVRCELKKPEDLPPELQLYLNSNTYLDWSDHYFWNKLWRVMPIPREVPTPGIALLHGQEELPSVRIQVALEANSIPALQLSGDKNLPLSELVLVPPTSVSMLNPERGQAKSSVQDSPVIFSVRPISPPNSTPTSRRIRRDPPDVSTPLSRRFQVDQPVNNTSPALRMERDPANKNTPLSPRTQRDPLPAPVAPSGVPPCAC